MKFQTFFVACALVLSGSALAQTPAKQWDRTLGGSGEERLAGMQPTRDGGSILVGASQSGISGDKTQAHLGGDDAWVVKVDALGRKQWDRTLGGTRYDGATSVQQTADGGYIVAAYSDSPVSDDKTQASQGGVDYWIIKLDAQGTSQWDRTIGGDADDTPISVQQTADGGYVLAGNSSSATSGDKSQASRGRSDYWVVKLDSQGNKQWDRTLGGSRIDAFTSLQPTPDGGYLLGGYSQSDVSGDKTQPSLGGYDFWLVKLDAQGLKQWDRVLGGSENDYLQGLQLTADGGALLAGSSYSGASGDKSQPNLGGRDFWLVKLNAQGTKQWDHAYGTYQEDYLTSLTLSTDGGCLFGSSDFSTYHATKLDAQGAKQWEQTLRADGGYTQLTRVSATSDGGYLLAGMSTDGAVNDKSEPSRGGELYGDYWVVKLAPAVLANHSAKAPAELRVYPNPARSSFTVQLALNMPPSGLQLHLVDAVGRKVLRHALTAASVQVPTDTLPAGLYWLRVSGPQGYQATQRIVLE
ncbi:T9SS type A sorting domain-containing protein [Hymenobacter cavernae]|uniref:Lipoprotein n=1 Tax=Hymenobacter cavernae TaxID=2044852 RepID=A0ABQ1UR61_9BACT|nr:T9SS type A sorting domain-containing protein [Hymenobacter cavernae]GGF23307.1 lipoprotein [Hymenobacter cavernae]